VIATRRTALGGIAAALLASAFARRAAAQDTPPPDALTPVRERYLALQTYADTGTVTSETQWEGAPPLVEGGRFTTFYRAPRNFFFDFVEDEASGGDRFVIWCDGGDFQSWWKTTGVHEIYDGGRGALGFLLGQLPTMGASMVIPGLIFARAELGGAVAGLREARDEGQEVVDGRPLTVIAADILVAGQVVRPRPTKLWVDPGTLLLHKVLEDTPPDAYLDRRTTIIAPQADIDIPDDRFTFVPPG
jgi:outer membrane lipoprotein-sorting protein